MKIDKPLKPLIDALNKLGIKTVGCCSGHNKNNAFVSIDMNSLYKVSMVDYRKYRKNYSMLFIEWNINKRRKK